MKNEKYFSKNRSYYLIFEEKGNLRLKDQNDNNIWSAITDDAFPTLGYVDNTCFLQRNGNLVIFDSENNVLWYSSQNLLQTCHGNCLSNDHCSSGLECYEQTFNGRRRRLQGGVSRFCYNLTNIPKLHANIGCEIFCEILHYCSESN